MTWNNMEDCCINMNSSSTIKVYTHKYVHIYTYIHIYHHITVLQLAIEHRKC